MVKWLKGKIDELVKSGVGSQKSGDGRGKSPACR